MKILALEFSSEQRSVAVAVTDGSANVLGSAMEIGGRSTRAIALIEKALEQAKLDRAAIECIAVGIGPGSYTGIRAAIALAQGWQLAKEVKILAISSVETIAHTARKAEIFGDVNIVIDAQRNEFYFARYNISQGEVREVEKLRLVPFAEIDTRAKAGGIIVGPDAAVFGGRQIYPEAAITAQLAAGGRDFIGAEELEPIYLRETTFVKAPPPRLI